MQNQAATKPKVDNYKGPKHLEPPKDPISKMESYPDPDAENFAEVGENVQKSMDQALEFQNQPESVSRKAAKNKECPLLLTYHH